MKMLLWLVLSLGLTLGVCKPLPSLAAEARPEILKDIGLRPTLGTILPKDELLVDESGKTVKLGDFFDGQRPVAFVLSYYSCPMLCGLILNGARDAFQTLDWKLGDQYKVVTISIDPTDTPALGKAKRESLLAPVQNPAFRAAAEKNWHFLVGKAGSEARVAKAFGFLYKFVPEEKQYAHGAALFLVTPEGKMSRVLEGVDFKTRDLKLGLLEASQGKVGTFAEKLLLFCYHYDPKDNKYALFASRLVSLGGVVTVAVILFSYLLLYLRTRRKGKACSLSP